MIDMASKCTQKTPVALPDPEKVRVERDRALALLYVQKNEARNAVAEIEAETGAHQRAIYRAITRQLHWAREEWAKQGGEGSPASTTDKPGREQSEATAPNQLDCTSSDADASVMPSESAQRKGVA